MTVVRPGRRISTRQEVAPVLAGPVGGQVRRVRLVAVRGPRAVEAVVAGEVINPCRFFLH